MMGLMANGTLLHASQEHSVSSVTGYRLYTSDMDYDKAVIVSDMSQVMEQYEIVDVKLPDGQTVSPEEVSYTVNESGDYAFEITYEDDSQEKTEEIPETDQIEDKADEGNSVQEDADIQVEQNALPTQVVEEVEQYREDNVVEPQLETETLTITVSLPVKEEEEETVETSVDDSQEAKTTAQKASNKTVQTKSSASSRANWGSYDDYNSKKTWTLDDFDQRIQSYSGDNMDYHASNNPDAVPNTSRVKYKSEVNRADNNNNGARFRFGSNYSEYTGTYEKNYLQSGLVTSKIEFDFSKDFMFVGEVQIGSLFGNPSESPNTEVSDVDGGATISFVPEKDLSAAVNNAKKGRGSGYNLGAYKVLKNSIVCEYDTSTDIRYWIDKSDGSGTAAVDYWVWRKQLNQAGDVRYGSGGAHDTYLQGKDMWTAANGITDSGNGREYKWENVSHIGISVTDYTGVVPVKSDGSSVSGNYGRYTTDRVSLGHHNTGTMKYEINYKQSNNGLTFKIQQPNRQIREVTMNVSQAFAGRSDKKMRLVFTFGAAYLKGGSHYSGYFSDTSNTALGPGQINVWAKEMAVTPDLQRSATDVRWLESGIAQPTRSTNNVAYVGDASNNSSSSGFANKDLYPVAGDRVYVQFEFKPYTKVMPQPTGTNSGTLTLRQKDIKVVDKNGSQINGLNVGSKQIYYRHSYHNYWSTYNGGNLTVSSNDVTSGNTIMVRIQLNLPELDNDSREEYFVTGKVTADYQVGNSKISYNLDLFNANGNKIPVTRDPKLIGFNGQDNTTDIRMILTGNKNNISSLQNITNGGRDYDAWSGNPKSIHYGVGYRPFSDRSNRKYAIYSDGRPNDTVEVKYKRQSMTKPSLNVNDMTTLDKDASLDFKPKDDIRYIIEYSVTDGTFNNASIKAGVSDRGKTTGKRVIWASDKVTVENGFEIYANKLSVTMSKQEFNGFANASNKGEYYRKIARAAGIKVFQTSKYDFTDLTYGNQTGISGNGVHTGVENALKNPGTAYEVPIQFENNATKVVKYIKLTITDDTPSVVATDGSIKDMSAEKIIFDGENFTVSGTFKLKKSDGTFMNYNDLQDKSKVKVALYKKNPSGKTHADKFYRWVGGSQADMDGQDTVNGQKVNKVEVPAKIIDNKDRTFTVTFTLYNHQDGQTTGSQNWISKEWDHLSEYRIYCWTDSNGSDIKYDNISDTGTDSVEIGNVGNKVPSSTTKMNIIEKDSGNLPSTMFEISNVKLSDDGTELSDKRKTTTISLKKITSLTDFNKAEHNYKYEVSVNETQYDTSNRPYAKLTQSGTNKTFNATYLKFENNKFVDVKKDNPVLGTIAYPSNKNFLPQSIRFGMRANQQNGLTSKTQFIGTGHFKFKRIALNGGNNP